MAGAQIGTSVTILSSGLKGWQAVSLTNFSGSAVSAIAAGSTVEIAGAFFIFGSEESVTGFSAITTAATAYVALTPSGTAGSQIVNAAWTSTAPTWSESKQGWYASAASVVRYVGGGVKTGTTALEPKWVLTQEGQNRRSDGGLTVPVDLSVLGAAAFTGAAAFNNEILPLSPATRGSKLFASSETYVLPRGIYTGVEARNPPLLVLEVQDSGGTWRQGFELALPNSTAVNAAIVSDGTHVRLVNRAVSATTTWYYVRF